MKRDYFILYNILVCVILFAFPAKGIGQELKIQTLADFDLKGLVKQCIVVTDYGKEEFNFNEAGFLVKSVTRFSENDYSVTHYKLKGDVLLEKRYENYIGGEFDKGTSLAHIFTIDSSKNKIVTENILTYTKKFLDQYVYTYNEENQLISIKRTNDENISNTKIAYIEKDGELTQTNSLENIPQQTIRTSTKVEDGEQMHITLIKKLYKGDAREAIETVKDSSGRLIKKRFFVLNPDAKGLTLKKSEIYSYADSTGVIDKIVYKTNKTSFEKTYIHQFDGENGNWIKQIVSPDNTYTTRKISYYIEPKQEE